MILFDTNVQTDTQGRNPFLILGAFLLVTAIGVGFALHGLVVGHHHVFGTTREVPWGLLVTPYVFFACVSTGICIISALGQVFKIKPFVPLVPRSVYLAIIAMVTGLMAIGLEIENPWNMALYGFLSPNPLSNIWWKSSLYTFFLLFTALNFLFLLMNRAVTARIMAFVALFAITCGNLNMNADMALLGARGFWAENYMPLFFLLVSVLSACSLLVLLLHWSSWVQNRTFDVEANGTASALFKLMVLLVIGMLAFSVMKAAGGFSPKLTENPEAMELLVRGDFALNFWIGEILLAGVLPLILLALSKGGKRFGVMALAGLCCAIGISVVFYDLIVVGQLIPHFHQYNLYGDPQLYSYSPTFNEFVIMAGSVSFFFALYLIGELFFNRISWKQ